MFNKRKYSGGIQGNCRFCKKSMEGFGKGEVVRVRWDAGKGPRNR